MVPVPNASTPADGRKCRREIARLPLIRTQVHSRRQRIVSAELLCVQL
jgi:hypothetical protein